MARGAFQQGHVPEVGRPEKRVGAQSKEGGIGREEVDLGSWQGPGCMRPCGPIKILFFFHEDW